MELTLDYKPHINQKVVHDAIDNKLNKFICLVASRQFGKTKLMLMAVVKKCFNDATCKTAYIVSPTDNQSKRLYDIMSNGLDKAHLLKSKLAKPGDYTLNLINDAKIQFKSAKSGENLRGSNVDLMVLDEAAFISQDIVYQILMPMIVTKKNAQFIAISTPNGKNWFYDFFNDCRNSNKDSAGFSFTWKDNPMVNTEIIDKFKSTLPEHIFNQEFECSFADTASVFSNIHKQVITHREIKPYTHVYVGIDIGMKADATVVSLISDKGQLISMLRLTNLEVDDLIRQINLFLEKYNVKRIYIEDNNQGIVIYQLLKKTWHNKITPFNTNSSTKPRIITQLITAFSQQTIQIIDNSDLILELNDFDYFINKETGRIKYAARSGHDDCVMALAIAWENYLKRNTALQVPIAFL
jgi:phage FluMu gp28-like protein